MSTKFFMCYNFILFRLLEKKIQSYTLRPTKSQPLFYDNFRKCSPIGVSNSQLLWQWRYIKLFLNYIKLDFKNFLYFCNIFEVK